MFGKYAGRISSLSEALFAHEVGEELFVAWCRAGDERNDRCGGMFDIHAISVPVVL